MSIRPHPWDYEDYASYLGALVAHLREDGRSFSFRAVSRKAGLASPNYLRLVIDRKKRLTPASATKFARALGLSEAEAEGLDHLVSLERAESDDAKARAFLGLKALAPKDSDAARMQREQFEIYKRWYVLPIREMLLLDDFQEESSWIAQRLDPPIKAIEAKKALELLERVGLATRDEEGVLKPTDIKLATPPDVRALAFRTYHRAALGNIKRALEHVPVERRHMSSVTLCLDETQYQAVCKRIDGFRLELLSMIEDADGPRPPKQEVHLLAFGVVPMTKGEKTE